MTAKRATAHRQVELGPDKAWDHLLRFPYSLQVQADQASINDSATTKVVADIETPRI